MTEEKKETGKKGECGKEPRVGNSGDEKPRKKNGPGRGQGGPGRGLGRR